jgi:integrase/recombinase XerD
MKVPKANIYFDRYHLGKDGKAAVTIRISHRQQRKYYAAGYTFTPKEFDRIMTALRRTENENRIYKDLQYKLNKALGVLESLPLFTFDKFEELYFENKDAADTITYGFQKYIEQLKAEDRIGTAVSYECAMRSFDSFKPGLKMLDVNRTLLLKYENWMISKGKTLTTVGIYMRSLRTIFNRSKIDRALYPFGDEKDKYSIPTGRNIKKALSPADVAKIYSYQPEPNSTEEMARDYWLFMYLCNGMNVKDLCKLKQANIKGEFLEYQRSKTERTKRDGKKIRVSLKPQTRAIIAKWGLKSVNTDAYLFPHLQHGLTAEREREIYQQLTKIINKYMKRIAKKLEIDVEVTTYFARHTFATILKNAGVSTEFISEALGHSDVKVTANYLDGFEQEQLHRHTDVLTAAFNQ